MATWVQVIWPVSAVVACYAGMVLGYWAGYQKGRKDGDKFGGVNK